MTLKFVKLQLYRPVRMATSDKLSFPEAFEIGIAGDSQTTDSVGSIPRSDYSGKFQIPSRPRMDVICVIDFQNPKCLSDRKKAFEEIKLTSSSWEPVTIHQIQVSLFFKIFYVSNFLKRGKFC